MAKKSIQALVAVPILLLATAATLGVYFLWTYQWQGPQTGGAITLRSLVLKRDYGNIILTVQFTYKNSGDMPVVMEPPFVHLVGDDDKNIPLFKLNQNGFEESSVKVRPRRSEKTFMKFLLNPEDLDDALFLVSGEERAKVKEKGKIDISVIPNQESVEFRSSDWSPKNLGK